MRTDKIAVSVIVPVYNVERYLRQCLDSLRAQTLKEIEIICVNDGSTDGCPGILEEYAKKDSRIRIISKENTGYGDSMNIGIRAAGGEYIGIAEPDDYVLPAMYKTLYRAAVSHQCEIVKADFYRFTGEGKTQEKTYNHVARSAENYNRVIDPGQEKECFRFIMNTWSGIYRRDFILAHNIFHNCTPGASYQDNGFYFKGFCHARRILFLNRPFYMNRRDNPSSSVASKEKVYCVNEEYRYIYEFLCEDPERKKRFIDVFQMKKLHTYRFNLQRIAPKFRKEYIRRMSEEYREAKQAGELDKAIFTPQEWTELTGIIRDPEEYYYTTEQNRIKVSVILPVYNGEAYLRQCLDSLVNQTLKEIEILCIDDGSVDGSPAILREYAAKDTRFTIFTTKNQGAGAARNLGLKEACGKYLSFLDSDDWFESAMLETAYRKAEEDQAEITIYRSMQYDNETGSTNPCTYSLRLDRLPIWRPFSADQIECSIFRNVMGWAWDKLYLRSFVLNNELWFQEQRTTNDMYFVYASLFKAGRITTCDQFLYYQRRNVRGSLSATRSRSWECFYQALTGIKKELKAMGIWKAQERRFVDYALHSCLWNLNSLPENEGSRLYDRLKKEWFDELGISHAPPEWFEYKEEYEQMKAIQSAENDYTTFRVERLKFENLELRKRIEEQMNFVPGAPVSVSAQEAEFYKHSLEEIRKSWSYRIGQAVTWVPRKIRGW